MQETIPELVRRMEVNYTSGNTTISKYVDFDMFENINKIEAYLFSKHINGDKDALERDKPFFNIVTAARNIWFRATDIDRKNIRLKPTKSRQNAMALVATLLLKGWMRKANFGQFLNDWGRTLATYGSAVSKFIEKVGELFPSVVPWNRIICDQIDFDNNPKIEILELTAAQLRKNKSYNQEIVKALLEAKATREDLNKQKRDNLSDYIKLYEVHGEFSLAQLKEAKDEEVKEGEENVFVQQMHVVSFVESENSTERNREYNDFTLYCGKEAQDPYQKDDLIKEDGRTMGIGAIEHLFEAQWMVNHSAKLVKDTLDFTSLLILQTSDGNLAGRNVLTSMITGNILIHAENQPLTQLNNTHDVTQIQNFATQWQNLAKEITSTPDSLRGETAPSGTAWRQVEALRTESHSLFEVMKENKGLAIEAMLRNFIIPYQKKQMDTTEEVAEILDAQGISQLDAMYIPNEVIRRSNKKIIDSVLSGEIAQMPDQMMLEQEVRKELAPLGNQRFIKPSKIDSLTWKKALKDFEWEPDVDVTDESTDKQAVLTTLSTILKTAQNNPALYRLIMSKILEETGHVSSVELSQVDNSQNLQPQTEAQKIKQPEMQLA